MNPGIHHKQDKTIMNQEKLEDFAERNDYAQEKTVIKQEPNYIQGNTVNNVTFLGVEQIKQEQDESIQVKEECNYEPENDCKETILRSNPEYKQLYEIHIVKDEFIIEPEVKQETCTNIECVPKDKAEYEQHMSEDENCHLRTKQRISMNKNPIKSKAACDRCNKVFNRKYNRDRHIKYYCPMNKNRTCKSKSQLEKECYHCYKVFTRKEYRDKHIKYYCPMNKNRTFKPKCQTQKVECNLCNKEFTKKIYRDRHIEYSCPMNKNRTIKPKCQIKKVECNLCHKEFTMKEYRNNHIKYSCPMNKNKIKFICDTCHNCYQSKAALVTHMMAKHSNTNLAQYQIECNLCNKAILLCRCTDS